VERQRNAQEVPSETTAHNTIIRLSAGHNSFSHVEHVVQDVEWNIDCAKAVVVWHCHTACTGWKNWREKPSKTYIMSWAQRRPQFYSAPPDPLAGFKGAYAAPPTLFQNLESPARSNQRIFCKHTKKHNRTAGFHD